MNFILTEMAFLRYFIPLIIEGNKRNIKSLVHWRHGGKYNCPQRHFENLELLSKKYNFDLQKISGQLSETKGPTFALEGVELGLSSSKQKTVLTCNINYTALYRKYKDIADYIIFPSEYFKNQQIEFQGKTDKFDSPKIKCLGSPKYDIEISKQDVLEKLSLNPSDKHCLIILPKLRDMNLINFDAILKFLKKLNYKTISKNRGKEGYSFDLADINFIDEYWYPHPTMELIAACDLVITFGSLAIKECVMLKTKVINFDVKPFKCLPELYSGKFCADIKKQNYTAEDLIKYHSKIENINDRDFEEYIEKFLFTKGSSKRILDFLSQS